jgi:hypothetical protein
MYDEMKNVVLKKVENPTTEKRTARITKFEASHLQSSLAMALQQRRLELTKNDIDESFENSDDWSD